MRSITHCASILLLLSFITLNAEAGGGMGGGHHGSNSTNYTTTSTTMQEETTISSHIETTADRITMKASTIIGITWGCIGVLLCCIFSCICFCRRRSAAKRFPIVVDAEYLAGTPQPMPMPMSIPHPVPAPVPVPVPMPVSVPQQPVQQYPNYTPYPTMPASASSSAAMPDQAPPMYTPVDSTGPTHPYQPQTRP